MHHVRSRRADDFLGAMFGLLGVIPAVLSALSGVIIIVGQCIGWLETAVWKRVTPRDFIEWWAGEPIEKLDSSLLGLNKILTWFLDGSEVSLWLIICVPLIWLLLMDSLSVYCRNRLSEGDLVSTNLRLVRYMEARKFFLTAPRISGGGAPRY